MLRYAVAVDDQWHRLHFPGPAMHVAARNEYQVDFWVLAHPDVTAVAREFRVFGTGQEIPAGCAWVGTGVTPSGALVWHLFCRRCDEH